ncbi:hypothetical protein ZHAS_00017845 [Anopheles sinensis]|uniref:Uncharacterized protein n=1 Tax=Anopheles sinensis TaxID=74873 RepID=A0A084WHY1_ANOSI|nr:hypothetical protein ZHAS_00017845 [Anopheles sinensis]
MGTGKTSKIASSSETVSSEQKPTPPNADERSEPKPSIEQTVKPTETGKEDIGSKSSVAFRRVKPKVSILPSAKSAISRNTRSSRAQESPPAELERSGGIVLPPQTSADVEQDTTKLNEVKNTNQDVTPKELASAVEAQQGSREAGNVVDKLNDGSSRLQEQHNPTSLGCSEETMQNEKVAQQSVAPLQQQVCVELQPPTLMPEKSVASQHHQRPAAPDSKTDKENVLHCTKSTTVVEGEEKRAIKEVPVTQSGSTTPSAPVKTIKRKINLGSLPPDVAKLLKSSIGKATFKLAPPHGGKLTTSSAGQTNVPQTVPRSDASTVPPRDNIPSSTKPQELDNQCKVLAQNQTSHPLPETSTQTRQSDCPTDEQITSASSTVETSSNNPSSTIPSNIVHSNDKTSPTVMSPPEEGSSGKTTLSIDRCSDASTSSLISAQTSIQLTEADNKGNVPTVAQSVPPNPAQHSSTGNKKIKKISFLTPTQQKMLMSSLMKGKSKPPEVKVNQPPIASVDQDAIANHIPPDQGTSECTGVDRPSTLTPTTPPSIPTTTVGTSSSERKVEIISHLVLPKLTFSPRRKDDSAKLSLSDSNSEPTWASSVVNPIDHPPPAVSDQYPKILIIHNTGPLSANSSSFSTPTRKPKPAAFGANVFDTGGVIPGTSTPHSLTAAGLSTPEKRHESPGLVTVTVLPRSPSTAVSENRTPPKLPIPDVTVTVVPAGPSHTIHPVSVGSSISPEQRIVPRIVIDKSFVDQDSQSSSSWSSVSSSEQPTKHYKAKSKQQLSSTSGKRVGGVKNNTETQSKAMGCSPKTRDRLRERILKNLESQKNPPPPETTLPKTLRCYPGRTAPPVGGSKTDAMEGNVSTNSTANALRVALQQQPGISHNLQPVDLRMHPTFNDMQAKRDLFKLNSTRAKEIFRKAEALSQDGHAGGSHNIIVDADARATVEGGVSTSSPQTHHTQRQEAFEFRGYSDSCIESDRLACDNQTRTINSILEDLAKKSNESAMEATVDQQPDSDRSSPSVLEIDEAMDSMDSPDQQDDYNAPSEEKMDVGVEPGQEIGYNLEEPLATGSQSSHDTVIPLPESSLSPKESPPPAQTHIIDVVEMIEIGKPSGMVELDSPTPESDTPAGETTKITHPVEREIIVIDEMEPTIVDSSTVQAEEASLEKQPEIENSEIPEESCEADREADRTNDADMEVDEAIKDDCVVEATNLDTKANEPCCSSTSTRSPPAKPVEDHEPTGVDLIVAMAMSMKQEDSDTEDEENSESDSEIDSGGNNFDETNPDMGKEEPSPSTNMRQQKVDSVTRSIQREKRKKKRDEFINLLLRHVNYESLMGELTGKKTAGRRWPMTGYPATR